MSVSTDQAAVASWLRKLCPRPEDVGSRLYWTLEPFHLVDDDADYWTVATDGKGLTAIAGLLPEFSSHDVPTSVGDYVGRHPGTCETIPLGILRRLLGPAEYVHECPCGGLCERCGGDEGMIYPSPRPVRWLGRVLDAGLLARFVEHVPGEDDAPVRLAWHESPHRSRQPDSIPLYLDSHGWRVVAIDMDQKLMMLAGNPLPLLGADYFRDALPHLRPIARRAVDDGSLGVLADAIEESGYEPWATAHCRQEHAGACWVAQAMGEGD